MRLHRGWCQCKMQHSSHVQTWDLDHKGDHAPENWCPLIVALEKTLESPLDCKEIKQSILKEVNPEYLLKELMLKLKLQYLNHLMPRADSLEKILMLGECEGRSRRGRERMRWLDDIINSMGMNSSKLQETVKDRDARSALAHGVGESDMPCKLNNNHGIAQAQLNFWQHSKCSDF